MLTFVLRLERGAMAAGGKRAFAVLVAMLAIGGLAACGRSSSAGSGSTPAAERKSSSAVSRDERAAQVLPKMQGSVAAAHSVHMSGWAQQGTTTTTIAMTFDGVEMAGTIREGGRTATVLSLGGPVYVKLTASFVKMAKLPARACAVFCGRYVELPAADSKQLIGDISMSKLLGQPFSTTLWADTKQDGAVFVPATFAGHHVSQYAMDDYTLDVARTGVPYPALYSSPQDSMTFSDWNSVTMPSPPPASQVVSLSQL